MVIEVRLNDAFAGGLDLRRLNIKDVPGLLSALATQGTVNVLASPTVNALNNEPAIMRVGTQDVFFKTTTQTDAATGRVLHTTEPHAITEGLVLSVTPQIGGRHDQHEHLASVHRADGRRHPASRHVADLVCAKRTLARPRQETIVSAG